MGESPGTVSTVLTDEAKLAVADRFHAASRGNDPEAFATLCAPGAITWHNYDLAEIPAEQSGRAIAWLHRTVADLSWSTVAVLPTSTGFVAQTVMTGSAPGGPLCVHSCVVVTLDGEGRITRLEEYLDPAQTAVLRG